MFKSQFYSMIKRRGFQLSFLFMLFMAFFYPIVLVFQHKQRGFDIASLVDPRFAFMGMRYSDLWDYAYKYLPLIMMLPFAYSYSSDKRTHYDCVMISRGGIRKYLFSKALCCMIGGFIVIFIPMVVNIIVNDIFLPDTSNGRFYLSFPEEVRDITDTRHYPIKSKDAYLWLVNPKLCFFLASVRTSILGAVLSLLIYANSMFIKNLKLYYFSVLPLLVFFNMSHTIQQRRDAKGTFSIEILEYAFSGAYSAYNPFFFPAVCGAFILFSFTVIYVVSKKDQI